ncbi:MAG: serine/threonine protein kinase [Chloroflexi bacterium]|nr:serine/threonine protein kinase [Chloroflexota bacterium]
MSELPIGTLLSKRYQVLGPLGTGGMALVYHARDLNLQREVAIKVLREDSTSDPSFQARFVHEARAAANLLHPNIVTVYDFGQDGSRTFIAMEYVQGTDLKTLMRRRGRLPIEEAVGLVIQACAGVGYAHRAGLVHCDLKPHNILVTSDGRAKITDFGIARVLASIRPEEVSEVVWGSPQYFAPEQAAGSAPSPASDVYSLGIILYEVLTGSLPFQAPDAATLARLHQSVPPPSPRTLNAGVPAALEQIVFKVLSKEPAARYRTADQLGRVLMTFSPRSQPAELAPQSLHDLTPPHLPEATTSPLALEPTKPDPLDWVAVALGLLAFLAVGGLVPLWLWACLMYPSCPLRIP